jgi:hypothetical protein
VAAYVVPQTSGAIAVRRVSSTTRFLAEGAVMVVMGQLFVRTRS